MRNLSFVLAASLFGCMAADDYVEPVEANAKVALQIPLTVGAIGTLQPTDARLVDAVVRWNNALGVTVFDLTTDSNTFIRVGGCDPGPNAVGATTDFGTYKMCCIRSAINGSVFVRELGHVLGVPDDTVPGSVMNSTGSSSANSILTEESIAIARANIGK